MFDAIYIVSRSRIFQIITISSLDRRKRFTSQDIKWDGAEGRKICMIKWRQFFILEVLARAQILQIQVAMDSRSYFENFWVVMKHVVVFLEW